MYILFFGSAIVLHLRRELITTLQITSLPLTKWKDRSIQRFSVIFYIRSSFFGAFRLFCFPFCYFSHKETAHHVNVPESVTKANLLWQSEEVDGSSKHWKKIFIKKQLSTAKSPKMQRRKENMNTYERLLIRCFLRHNSAVSDSSCLHAY